MHTEQPIGPLYWLYNMKKQQLVFECSILSICCQTVTLCEPPLNYTTLSRRIHSCWTVQSRPTVRNKLAVLFSSALQQRVYIPKCIPEEWVFKCQCVHEQKAHRKAGWKQGGRLVSVSNWVSRCSGLEHINLCALRLRGSILFFFFDLAWSCCFWPVNAKPSPANENKKHKPNVKCRQWIEASFRALLMKWFSRVISFWFEKALFLCQSNFK